MPVRFTSPSLGGQANPELRPHQWQVGVAFRRLTADNWFIGSILRADKSPFGQPVYLSIQSVDVTATYAMTKRANLTVTVPFVHATQSRFYADGARHVVSSTGISDANASVNIWLHQPDAHLRGNVALGAGVKTPAGNNAVTDSFYTKAGTTSFAVDQSIQLGDGGWGVILQAQGFREIGAHWSGYGSAWYLVSPRRTTDVRMPNGDGTPSSVSISVPDVYSGRGGIVYAVWPSKGVSVNAGVRVDGIPLRDLIGGGDNGFRRPGFTTFVDLGVAVTGAKNAVTFSVPVRVYQNFKPDLTPGHPVGGDLAKYLLYMNYTRRF